MATTTTVIDGKTYTIGIDRANKRDFARSQDVLVPPTPEQIDSYIAQYKYAKAIYDEAKAVLGTEKDKIVFLVDRFGCRAPGAEQSLRLAGLRNAAMVTRGSSVVVDEAAVLELKQATKPLPTLFACLFSSQTTHKLLKGAREVLLGLDIPRRKHEKLLALFGKCFDVKTNEPSLKVEVIKPEKPAKQPRLSKSAKAVA